MSMSEIGPSVAGMDAPQREAASPVRPPLPPPAPAASWPGYLTVAALILAHLPLLVVFAWQSWLRPHYQFFPLAVLGAAILLVRAARRLGPLTPGPALLSALLLGGSWAL